MRIRNRQRLPALRASRFLKTDEQISTMETAKFLERQNIVPLEYQFATWAPRLNAPAQIFPAPPARHVKRNALPVRPGREVEPVIKRRVHTAQSPRMDAFGTRNDVR